MIGLWGHLVGEEFMGQAPGGSSNFLGIFRDQGSSVQFLQNQVAVFGSRSYTAWAAWAFQGIPFLDLLQD